MIPAEKEKKRDLQGLRSDVLVLAVFHPHAT